MINKIHCISRQFFGLCFVRNSNKYAFTLAEVLITLGIIGVVAAMTLPTLINSTRHKELYVGLQKAYSILQQAVQRMNYEEGLDVTWENYPANKFAPVFKKYIQQYGDCGQSGCITADLTSDDDKYSRVSKYKTYNKSQNVTLDWFNEGQAILTDGMFIMINNSSTSQHGIVISVDVNGYGKGPNAWGHDLFSFEIYKERVIPMGSPNNHMAIITGDENAWTGDCSKESSARDNGLGCTYRALTDNDYFKNLP